MKIGRNDPCPCKSGKKFKKCCIDKSIEEKYFEAINSSMNNLKNLARIKGCLHPENDKCEGKIVKAHAIQNNKILKRISENGHLVTMDERELGIFQTSEFRGRKIATTFKGFCQKHDKQTFQPIEDSEIIPTEEQIFLFTYRTLAWHFQKKKEQINAADILSANMKGQGYPIKNDKGLDTGFELAERDNIMEITNFNRALIGKEFSKVSSFVWEIPYEVDFAISMVNEINHDILGNKINDLSNEERTKKLYLNIIPVNHSTLCIWSWLDIWDDYYVPFEEQFARLSFKEKCNYLNNNLPLWSDSLIISPKLWNSWGEDVRSAFMAHANMDFLYDVFRMDSDDNVFEYMYTPWDLFQKTK